MKRIRFTEEQIIAVLREHEAGARTADLARKHGISEATLYNWKAKYGGMDVSDAKRLRSLEEENRKLKKLLAESMLDQAALKELLTKRGDHLAIGSDEGAGPTLAHPQHLPQVSDSITLGGGPYRELALRRTGAADAERIHRILQRPNAR